MPLQERAGFGLLFGFQRRQGRIYCGLVSGYSAKQTGYPDEKRLYKVKLSSGYCL
jgi:hypothetical protein